jgi:hypothetical protein
MADIYVKCQRHDCIINSTSDPQLGNLVDANDHPRCLDAWAESLKMAERFEIPHPIYTRRRRPTGQWSLPMTSGRMKASVTRSSSSAATKK